MKCQDNDIYAGFFVRFFAFLIDSVIVICITGFFSMILGIIAYLNDESILNKSFLFDITWMSLMIYICKVSYYIITTYSDGSTVGKRAMKIKVVSSRDIHEKLELFDVIYRETIGKFLSSIMNVGYIMIGVTNKKTGIHDILCDTRVVYYTRFVVRKTIYKTMVDSAPNTNATSNSNIPKEVGIVLEKKDDKASEKKEETNSILDEKKNTDGQTKTDNTIDNIRENTKESMENTIEDSNKDSKENE